jgi:hypothetical protein
MCGSGADGHHRLGGAISSSRADRVLDGGSSMDSFKLIVECGTPEARHQHEVTIRHAPVPMVGAAPPGKVRLQYTCPVSGVPRMMTFRPPRGAARPFDILTLA